MISPTHDDFSRTERFPRLTLSLVHSRPTLAHTRIMMWTTQVAARLPNAMEMTTHVGVNLATPSA